MTRGEKVSSETTRGETSCYHCNHVVSSPDENNNIKKVYIKKHLISEINCTILFESG